MVDFKIEIVEDNTEKLKQILEAESEKILTAIGMHIEGEAKEELSNDPKRIDTGLLRNSITYAVSGGHTAIRSYHAEYANNRTEKGERYHAGSEEATSVNFGSYSGQVPEEPNGRKAVYIGSNTEYAPYVHEGTTKMTANHFLKNAAEKNKTQVMRYIKEGFQRAVESL